MNKKIIICIIILLAITLIAAIVGISMKNKTNTTYDTNDEEFVFVIEDVFNNKNIDIDYEGVSVTGHVEKGIIHQGDEIKIIRTNREPISTKVTSLMMFRKTIESAKKGDVVSIIITDVEKSDIESGQTIISSK